MYLFRGNDKKKKTVHVQYIYLLFPPNHFDLCLVESANAEPIGTEGQLYIPKCWRLCSYFSH